MIGLSGSHRTGKTTLAKAWAEEERCEYVTPDVSGVIKEMGMECSDIDTIDTRIEVQRRIVQKCQQVFLKRKSLFITDRTPLDVAAYTLADAGQNLTPTQSNAFEEIVEDCIELTNSCFHSLVLVQPGIPYVAEKGKPLPNVAYQSHIHSLIIGLLQDQRSKVAWWSVPRSITLLEDRLDALRTVHGALVDNASYEAEGMLLC